MFRIPQPSPRHFAFVAFLVVALAFGAWILTRPPEPARLPFSTFLRDVEAGSVRAVRFEEPQLEFTLRDGRTARTTVPSAFLVGNPGFVADLVRRGVEVDVRSPESGPTPGSILLALAALAAVAFLLKRGMAWRVPLSEGSAGNAPREGEAVTFADVAGVDEAKDEVKEIVDFLREPERFSSLGGRIPTGVLLVGPPGTGKTLLARSIAGEAHVPFLFASGSDFVEMFAGVGAARIRKLFREARRHPSCILFIDELDAVGRSRGGQSLSHEEREQTLNQLLVEMDGFRSRRGIVVIAATNRPDILDPALLRPGRFDRQVVVGHPDLRGREAILRVHARRLKMGAGVDLREIARGTPGFSGAELANLLNEAALLAGRRGRLEVSRTDLDEARDKVMMGAERRSITLSEQERITCAYHEAGHAMIASLLPLADPLHKVTIIPRGRALGVTMQLPEADRHTHGRAWLETQIAVLMGGRAAEELALREATSGASNDIERATDIARRMVCEFGMSPLGPLAFRRPGGPFDAERPHGMSEDTARRVDEETHAIVLRGFERARGLLEKHRGAFDAMAHALLDLESLEAEEIRTLLLRHGLARTGTGESPEFD